MFLCLDCKEVFEEPNCYIEYHGQPNMPGEVFYTCPYCDGAFVEAFRCDGCDEYITDNYAETAHGTKYCEECYIIRNVED